METRYNHNVDFYMLQVVSIINDLNQNSFQMKTTEIKFLY